MDKTTIKRKLLCFILFLLVSGLFRTVGGLGYRGKLFVVFEILLGAIWLFLGMYLLGYHKWTKKTEGEEDPLEEDESA